jgi:ribulose-5-phosphate 4-epimerase/fuculose-1-phosphate aldolase
MNREMLRLRPDIHCVIHLHHDETVALLSVGVEEDLAPIKTFIQDTNCVLLKRIVLAELLAAARGTKPDYISKEDMETMFRHGDAVMYPKAKPASG